MTSNPTGQNHTLGDVMEKEGYEPLILLHSPLARIIDYFLERRLSSFRDTFKKLTLS